jgi:hypothetical protein
MDVHTQEFFITAEVEQKCPRPGITFPQLGIISDRSLACKKMLETYQFQNPVSGKQYSIRRSYNCKSSRIIANPRRG